MNGARIGLSLLASSKPAPVPSFAVVASTLEINGACQNLARSISALNAYLQIPLACRKGHRARQLAAAAGLDVHEHAQVDAAADAPDDPIAGTLPTSCEELEALEFGFVTTIDSSGIISGDVMLLRREKATSRRALQELQELQ
jgi:hypothetical protein